jgi:hypothetical protein
MKKLFIPIFLSIFVTLLASFEYTSTESWGASNIPGGYFRNDIFNNGSDTASNVSWGSGSISHRYNPFFTCSSFCKIWKVQNYWTEDCRTA